METNKSKIRKKFLKLRDSFFGKTIPDKLILERLLYECKDFSSIFTYISYGTEVDTISFIKELISMGKDVFVPVCDTESCTMRACKLMSLKNLKKNKYGIFEPVETESCRQKLDAIILPGIAFDLTGNRVGYGKGYYDKFISSLLSSPVKIGICYDFQLTNRIPAEDHDIPVDVIITDSRTIRL